MDLLEAARQLASLVQEEARRVRVPVTFCAIDIHGNVILKQRMMGAILVSIEMSERKAYTSAALPMQTADMTPLAQPGHDLYTLASVAGARHTMLGGGADSDGSRHLQRDDPARVGVTSLARFKVASLGRQGSTDASRESRHARCTRDHSP